MALSERLVRDRVVGVFFHASSCPLLIQKKKEVGKKTFTHRSKNNRHHRRIVLFVSTRWNAGGKAVVVIMVIWVGRWV